MKILGAQQPVSLAEEDFTPDPVTDTVKGNSTVYSRRRKHPMASTHTSTVCGHPWTHKEPSIHTAHTHMDNIYTQTDQGGNLIGIVPEFSSPASR